MKPLAQNSMIQNRYLVVQMIGKGGMGEVYLAVDQRLGSAVALKRTMFKENDGLASAFEREAKILGRLRHPVLPKVIDHFIEGNDQYLVMEHITGEDLGKRLEAAGKPFPLSWVMFWCDQLLDALNYMHSHEPPIIHRDIKPENLKLTDDNHIVLLDFGLSKDFDSRADTASLGTGSVVGYSPYFASMEQVRGTGTDARSDLYSFSATIYQLLTNTMPADSLTRADAMLGGVADPVLPISSINSEVPPAVSEVILRGMSVRQDERFSSASEMQRVLRRAFNSAGSATSGADKSEAQTRMMSVPAEIMAGADTKPSTPLEINTENTIPANYEAQTQLIPQVPTLGNNQEPAVVATDMVATAMMPDPKLTLENVPTDPSVRQADIQTQVIEAHEDIPEPAVSEAAVSAISAADPAVKKKSRKAAVAGGLVGLLAIAGLAAGGGWFAYTKYSPNAVAPPSPVPTAETPAATATPLPSPTVAAETTPSPEPTAQQNETSPRAADREPGNPQETRPGQSNPTAKATPKPQPPKSTPKPKAPGDRTVILQ